MTTVPPDAPEPTEAVAGIRRMLLEEAQDTRSASGPARRRLLAQKLHERENPAPDDAPVPASAKAAA
jgi:hypothetical protein